MRLRVTILIMVLILGGVPAFQTSQAQEDEQACTQLVQRAFSKLGTNCANLGRNSICYGFDQVQATFAGGEAGNSFSQPGDHAALTTLMSVQTTALDVMESAWGIAVMKVQANVSSALPDQNAVYLLLGDVEMTNAVPASEALLPIDPVPVQAVAQAELRRTPGQDAQIIGTVDSGTTLQVDGISPDGVWLRVLHQEQVVWGHRPTLAPDLDISTLPVISRNSRSPMQAFTFRTDPARAACEAAVPSMVVVQSPKDIPVDIMANGIDIRVGSVVFLRTLVGDALQIITGDGAAIIYPDTPYEVVVPAGVSAVVMPGGSWQNWRLLGRQEWSAFAPLEGIPKNIWLYPYTNPIIIQGSGIGEPELMVQTPEGVFTPTSPLLPTFPVITMVPGALGVEIERPAWASIPLGEPLCPPWVLYHSDRDGDWDIYRLGEIIPEDATDNVSQGDGSADIQPSYAADGVWVAFTSDRDSAGGWEIFLGRIDGSQQVRLTYNTAADINPVWGPGSLVVFESNRNGNWELYVVDVARDGLPVRLTDDPADDINPFWTPDGEQVAFQSDRDGDWEIYLLDVTSGALTQLTDNETADFNPVISHNGRMLAWLQMNEFGVYDLWVKDLANGQARRLTDTGTDVSSHNFAPDDTFLAYQSNVDGDFDIFAVDVASGLIKPLTENIAEDLAPTFRCDSSRVVYFSDVAADQDHPDQHELFEVDPLPLDGPANPPVLLTYDQEADDVFPLGDPREECDSRATRIVEETAVTAEE